MWQAVVAANNCRASWTWAWPWRKCWGNKHEYRMGNWVIMHAVAANDSIKVDDLIRRLEKKRKREKPDWLRRGKQQLCKVARDQMLCNFFLYLPCPIPFPFPFPLAELMAPRQTSQAGPGRAGAGHATACHTTTSASHIFRIVPHPGIESSPSVHAKRPTTCAAVSWLPPTPSPSPSPSRSEPELQARQLLRVWSAKSASGCHQVLLNNSNVVGCGCVNQ